MEISGDLLEGFDAFFGALGLGIGDVFAAGIGFEVFGEVACVGRDEVLVQRDRIGHEFDDAGGCCEGEDFVCSDTEVALTGGALGSQEIGDLREDLLHDGILPEVVIPAFELRVRQRKI